MTRTTLSVVACESLACEILQANHVSHENARCVATALVAAEIDGQSGHGLSRLPSYVEQLRSGKVDGAARPKVIDARGAALRIDAANGFAYPALALARQELCVLTTQMALAGASVFRSHHFGQAGYHVEEIARAGFVGILFGNSPQAIAPWGGAKAVFGTNPIALAVPRIGVDPLVIDLSLSKVARGKVMVAAQQGTAIPEGWALDAEGHSTTDANAAMAGTMLPMGDAKGAALVLMVEILAACLTGANLGFQASSFFSAEGEPPGVGQCLLVFDSAFFSGEQFQLKLASLLEEIDAQQGARLPGQAKPALRKEATEHGVTIDSKLYERLLALK